MQKTNKKHNPAGSHRQWQAYPQASFRSQRINPLFLADNPSDWAKYLLWAELAQNSLLSSTTGLTPFQCVLGYQPPLAPWTGSHTDVPAVDHWMRRSEQVWEGTHQRIEAVLQRHKEQADRHRGPTPTFQPGDRVWLATRDFRNSEGSCRKLQPKYIGPFKIVKRINDVTYKLDLPPRFRVSRSFHVSLLRPVVAGPLDEATPDGTPPRPELIDGAPVYAVRRLLDSRRRGGVLQYLVDWEGYAPYRICDYKCWINPRTQG